MKVIRGERKDESSHCYDAPYRREGPSEIGCVLIYASKFCYGHCHVLDNPKVSGIYKLLYISRLP